MLNGKYLLFVTTLVALGTGLAASAQDPATIDSGKRATAYLSLGTEGSASAFCVDQDGYFVTTFRTIRSARGPITLVLNPTASNQRATTVRTVRTDENADLALLQTTERTPCTPLELGETSGLIETARLVSFGYPFGRALATGKNEYPAVSVSVGRVTSLRSVRNVLNEIQLDASLNPGNSGGPVLNEQGKVVGIVQGGVPGAALNFAIPVEKLKTLLKKPTIEFRAASASFESRTTAQELVAEVKNFNGSLTTAYAVSVTLPGINGNARTLPLSANEGRYTVSAPLVTLRPGADRLKISATFANGLVAGEVSDREVRAVDRTLRLGRIARIDRGSQKPKIVLGTGEELEGVIDALDQAQLDVGGTRIPVDLSRAIRIDISPVFPPERTVSYTVTVKDGAQTIAESTGTITLTDPPIRVTPVAPANNAPSFASIPGANNNTSPSNLQALRINAVRETIKLPAPVDDVVLGGGGRYLILAMSKARQLAVLDINAGRIAKFLPLPTENVRIAAGAEKLFVLLPETNTLQRWNLATMDRDLTTTLNVSNFRGMALGYASSGPLAVSTSNALMFFDTDSLKRIEMRLAPGESVTPINNLNIEGPELNASADGTAFAGRSGKHALVKVDGTTMTIAFGEIGTSNVAFPSYDGSFIFTNFSGVLFPNFQPMSKTQFRETQTIPSLSPGFFVGLKASETPSRNGVRMQKFSFDVYALTDLRPLVSFSELDELVTALDPVPGETRLPMQKRVFFAPESNMLITIPMSRDEVVLRNIDLLGEINKTGIDYLFVASMPVSRARSGQRYRYEVDVKSRSGGVQYKIEIGPSGMRIDSKGEISWDVPPTAQGPTKVVVSARDASGQEIYHTFNITVR